MNRRLFSFLALVNLLAIAPGRSDARPAVPPRGTLVRPAASQGITLVPDRLLRRWDPVTLFLEKESPVATRSGLELSPERFVTMRPQHPGAWEWLDGKTLQFRPTVSWPTASVIHFEVGEKSFRLETLLSPPVSTTPADGAADLSPMSSVVLTYSEPLDPSVLAQRLKFELRSLPGIEGAESKWLTSQNFSIKSSERHSNSELLHYRVEFSSPIPEGTKVLGHLKLAQDDADDATYTFGFSTARPFRVTQAGVSWTRFPVTPGGSQYPKSQAILGDLDQRYVVVEFTRAPEEIGPMAASAFVQFEPPLQGMSATVQEKQVMYRGNFLPDQLYKVTVNTAPLKDKAGQLLKKQGPTSFYFHFPAQPRYLKWAGGQGILERFGPKMVPMEGRGESRLDLRIHPVDPRDQNFWPFPHRFIASDESNRPPGPGEEPKPRTDFRRRVTAAEIQASLRLLGSPAVSQIVSLPLAPGKSGAKFGLDLAPHLAKISGKEKPGTYLVGMRRLDGSNTRNWMRVQVTDLVLTTVETSKQTRFLVTSIRTGKPLGEAQIRVEGTRSNSSTWQTLFEGSTEPSGELTWRRLRQPYVENPMRITVELGDDLLVFDPGSSPERFTQGLWQSPDSNWLKRTNRMQSEPKLTHLFSDRPVYRPGEAVHLKAYLRKSKEGELEYQRGEAEIVVQAPGGRIWRHRTTLDSHGAAYYKFEPDDSLTGWFRAWVEFGDLSKVAHARTHLATMSFRMEAYRVPRFQVDMHAPTEAALDSAFEVSLSARYYAGGKVAGQPVNWRVTRAPYLWIPGEKKKGYVYSSDGRYAGVSAPPAIHRSSESGVTTADGAATLKLDPTADGDARPRMYTVEATIVGADDQTVSATSRIRVLPAFVLGLKVPRYVEKAKQIPAEVLVIGPDGKSVHDKALTIRVKKREWHSHLRESDFAGGEARWVTDPVDRLIQTTELKSTQEPLVFDLPTDGSGVYLIEVEAQDSLGRAQQVAVDLFLGGDDPVSWKKPTSRDLTVRADKKAYVPGDLAKVVVESPFQEGMLLMALEEPEGVEYRQIPVKGGLATVKIPIEGHYVPKIPVHFLLWRGRLEGTHPDASSGVDLGKPATLAATEWLSVKPVENRVTFALETKERALPGEEIEVKLSLENHEGEPLAGQVTLWMVDQAVLALGEEARLDPLPDFLTPVGTELIFRDTRGLSFGYLPFAELPGGGYGLMAEADEMAMSGFAPRQSKAKMARFGARENRKKDQGSSVTVRKNFATVPFFLPNIEVDASGRKSLKLKLPDNLTNFKIRAKAVSGPKRFGSATGQIAVRLPLVVQPAMPRFVRPGDQFDVAAVSRILEGEGGVGSVELDATGLVSQGGLTQEVTLQKGKPSRASFGVTVENPSLRADGTLETDAVRVSMAVRRKSDGAADAFEVFVPLVPDRRPVRRSLTKTLTDQTSLQAPALEAAIRPGTLKRRVRVSDRGDILDVADAVEYLIRYPHNCTEQRLSKARAYLAAGRFEDVLGLEKSLQDPKEAVTAFLAWLPTVVRSDGLVSYWPGSTGYVSLTAWVLQFLVDAEKTGHTVSQDMKQNFVRTLTRSLRSDYGNFIEGESFAERTFALLSLASANSIDEAYAGELARRANSYGPEVMANVSLALARTGDRDSYAARHLRRQLWEAIVFQLWQGKEKFRGFQDAPTPGGLLLNSEVRTLARVFTALQESEESDPRMEVLLQGILERADTGGWGSTQANAAAIEALTESLIRKGGVGSALKVQVTAEGRAVDRLASEAEPVILWKGTGAGAIEVSLEEYRGTRDVVARVETSYLPVADGSTIEKESHGFVVSREWLRVDPESRDTVRQVPSGRTQNVKLGQIIEEHIEVTNAQEHSFVAIEVPLAAGMEPMNPNLATSPEIASPSRALSLSPSYSAYLDDRVVFYYDLLPKGTYHLSFRTRASTEGSFIQPPARAEMMYRETTYGNSEGVRVVVRRD